MKKTKRKKPSQEVGYAVYHEEFGIMYYTLSANEGDARYVLMKHLDEEWDYLVKVGYFTQKVVISPVIKIKDSAL